jgi:peptide/nickel transport system substrate-binding protein
MRFPARCPPAGRRVFRVLVGAGFVWLSACQGPAAPQSEPRTLRIGTQKTVESQRVISGLLYADPLFAFDWNGRPSLRLASDYQWQDDGRSLRLTLRSDVRFHDGSPLSTAVVMQILQKKERSGGFEYVTHVESPGNGVILIHLSRPDIFLLDELAGTSIVLPGNPDIGTGP